MSERGEGLKNRGVSAPGAGRESSGRKDIRDLFKPASEMVAKISGGDVESLYGLREWWANQVSRFVFETEPVSLTFSKDGKKRTGNFGVLLGERKLYCSEQVDEAELDEDKMAKWDFLKEGMSAAAADGLTKRWGADGIKSSLASAGNDEEKEKALVRQWIGGQNGPLAGLEGEVLDRLKGVVVEDGEIGMRGANPDEEKKGKKKKKKKDRDDVLVLLTQVLGELGQSMTSERNVGTDYATFVNAEYIQQPLQPQFDAFPPIWFKNPPDRFRGSSVEWQQLARARVRLTNAAYVKAEVAALDGEAAMKNSWLKLTEEELGLVYREPGVRESMESMMIDFFERDKKDPSGTFFLALKKGDVAGKGWKGVLAEFRDYQDVLVRGLIEKGMSDLDAKAAVAMAWNFLYVSNVFESADTDRDIPGSCGNVFGEQIRAMMHPLGKAKRKFAVRQDLEAGGVSQGTEEGWGGKVGAWFADMMTWDETRPDFESKLNSGELVPFPRRIGASMIETMEVEVIDDVGKITKMSMARALLEKKHIVFGKSNSNLFGEYGDKWDTYWKYYQYAVGKVPLQRWDKESIHNWSGSLADVLAKVRSISYPGTNRKMFVDLDSANSFAWLILNTVGIVRSSKYLVADLSSYNVDYHQAILAFLRQPRLVPEKEKSDEVMKILNARATDALKRLSAKRESLDLNTKRKD